MRRLRGVNALSARGRRLLTASGISTVLLITAAAGASPASAARAPGEDAPSARASRDLPAAEPLGKGWEVRSTPAGRILSYQSETAIPITDGQVRVYAGKRDLGPAVVEGRTVTVPLAGAAPAVDGLRVMLGESELREVTARMRTAPRRALKVPSAGVLAKEIQAALPSEGSQPASVATTTFDYDLGDMPVPGFKAPADITGHVIAPKDATTKHPVVLFMHGRHATCYGGGEAEPVGAWPCAKGTKPIPSMLGYTYLQTALAQRGFVTISVDANAINSQDEVLSDGGSLARGRLVREHLRGLSGAKSPLAGKVNADLSKVVLVGHSRGGEGVNQASVLSSSAEAYRIAGVVHIAPTNFSRFSDPLTPSLTLLPNCDGDVSDLQGQQYVDHALDSAPGVALHSSLYVAGAGHNSFNTEWTPGLSVGGAWDDNTCAKGSRLTHAQHRRVAAAYIWAAARGFTDPEAATPVKMLDGRISKPNAVKKLITQVTPVGGPRDLVWRGKSRGATLRGGSYCRGTGLVAPGCGEAAREDAQPHWPLIDQRIPLAVKFSSTTAGPVTGFDFARARNLSARPWLEARVAVQSGAVSPSFRLTDAAGKSVVVPAGNAPLKPRKAIYPMGSSVRLLAQMVRAELPADGSINLRQITRIELLSARPASGHLLDIALAGPGLGPDRRADLPVLTMPEKARMTEGRRAVVVAKLSRPAAARARIMVSEHTMGNYGATSMAPRTRVVTIPAGATSVRLPVSVKDNKAWDGKRSVFLSVESRGRILVDSSTTMVAVRDNDPAPKLSVVRSWASAREGGTLRWEVRLSQPVSSQFTELSALVMPAGKKRPLQIGDLTEASRMDWMVSGQGLSKPLSGLATTSRVLPGGSKAVVTMKTRRDGVKEPWEFVKIKVSLDTGVSVYVGGSVRD